MVNLQPIWFKSDNSIYYSLEGNAGLEAFVVIHVVVVS